jgi:integrase/recombinase XerD
LSYSILITRFAEELLKSYDDYMTPQVSAPSTFTVTVFTRHSTKCPKQNNPNWKRCDCRKSVYIYEDGKVRYVSAKTRSWEQAEKFAQAERDARDPVKLELQKIAELRASEEEAAAAREASQVTIDEALNRWIRSRKKMSDGTDAAYRVVVRKILAWAAHKDLKYLNEITPELLDEWRGLWSPVAARKQDRIGQTTQSHFLTRLKGFFSYATRIGLIASDPTLALGSIAINSKQTMPLNKGQFEELLAATEKHDAEQTEAFERYGAALKVIFLVMRWTGLRLIDVLKLRRTALLGNRLLLSTQKTKDRTSPILPDSVRDALLGLKPLPSTGRDYFFSSGRIHHLSLTSMWTARIRELNRFLSFKDDQGQRMEFRSHMLRDTFAVEMLLSGMSLEDVSKLLTHKSIRVTERYYAPWIKSRQEQLDEKVIAAMRKMGATVSIA